MRVTIPNIIKNTNNTITGCAQHTSSGGCHGSFSNHCRMLRETSMTRERVPCARQCLFHQKSRLNTRHVTTAYHARPTFPTPSPINGFTCCLYLTSPREADAPDTDRDTVPRLPCHVRLRHHNITDMPTNVPTRHVLPPPLPFVYTPTEQLNRREDLSRAEHLTPC